MSQGKGGASTFGSNLQVQVDLMEKMLQKASWGHFKVHAHPQPI